MFPTIQIGPLSIATPGLIILIGLWIGLELSERRAHDHQITPNLIYNLTFWCMIAGIIGARLAFAARYAQPFLKNPLSLISLNTGMLDPLAGIIVGGACFLIYTRWLKAPIWNLLDALTPGVVFFSFAVSFSQLASGSWLGLPTSLPWAIRLWNVDRHPTQIYSMLAVAGIFAWVWSNQKRMASLAPGSLFLAAISFLSASHLLISGFRADGSVLLAGIRSEQLIAWAFLAVGMWAFQKRTSDHNQI